MKRQHLFPCVVALGLGLFPQALFAQNRDLEVIQDAQLEFLPILDWPERLQPTIDREEEIQRELKESIGRLVESGAGDVALIRRIRVLLRQEADVIQNIERGVGGLGEIVRKVDQKLGNLSVRFASDRLELKSHYEKAIRDLQNGLALARQWANEYDQALRALESGAAGRFEKAKIHFQKAIEYRRKSDAAGDSWGKELEAGTATFERLAEEAVGLTDKESIEAVEKKAAPRSPLSPERHEGDLDVIPRIVRDNEPSVVLIITRNADGQDFRQGSGFIVDSTGVVVTNYHVIEGAISGSATLAGGTKHDILGVVALSRNLDLAVLKIRGTRFPTVKLGDATKLAKGEKVIAIGSPVGLPNVVSDGLISSIWSLDDITLIQTTAPVSEGSSGGPLFNLNGEVVGITSLILTSGQNLTFAVPINYVKPLLTSKEVKMTLTMLALKSPIPELPLTPSPPPPTPSMVPPPTPARPIEPAPWVLKATPPEQLYKNALRDYINGNYESAISGFRSYIALYPKTSLQPIEAMRYEPYVQYWLGESYYSVKNYDLAIKEFDLFVKEHPGNPKVASAMLKQGFAYLEMGDKPKARMVLDNLLKQFPKSQEARWAKERLNQVEGN